MRNMISRVMLLALLSLFLVGDNAFAAFELESYATMFMTSTKGVIPTSSKTDFNLNEQPWLYIRFFGTAPETATFGGSKTDTTWIWEGGEVKDKPFLKVFLGTKNDLWLGFSGSYWKNNMQIVGDWTVSAKTVLDSMASTDPGGDLRPFGQTINFRVNAVPEPVSALLFLTGGAALAAFRRRRV